MGKYFAKYVYLQYQFCIFSPYLPKDTGYIRDFYFYPKMETNSTL